ncbi:spore maturation protein [Marvinbryantia formatexigens DSM 14469]|nr:nucleoside recognition domain-containing protein [Marvinbryantia formatexigens]UWO26513.1 spore maturation protein [Marvinbryantia formatexigens DSM 14469]
MNILMFLSAFMIPLVIFIIVGYGLLMKKNVYEIFVKGAADGLKTVVTILPTLVGLMAAVGILRASGFLDLLSSLLGRGIAGLGFPPELVPLSIVRLFSSSAATGLALDIFKEYGPDSRTGLITSIMMSCTETVFYTMSVYFMTAKVKKTRYTLAGALLATFAGIAASVFLADLVHG